MASKPASALFTTDSISSSSCCSSTSGFSTVNTSGIRDRSDTLMSSFTSKFSAICFIAARYPATMDSFRVTFTSAAPSERTDRNTSTLPREMAFFTACFTASSPKDRLRGSFTVQSR